ncbi:MAG: Rpn family recombination-promoting nuclease/putative transposase, partial [Chitinophagales bacterium]
MNTQAQKHDRFVKALFSQPEKARQYFEDSLPENVLKQIDLNSLQVQSGSFIDEKLNNTFSDILFKVRLKDKKESCWLSVLVEHKSRKDRYVTVQIGHYIFSALLQQIREKKKPAPIVPVLFYHGAEKWDYHTHRSLYDSFGSEILSFVPEFDYIFDNLQKRSDREIMALSAKLWSGSMLLLKYARDEDYLVKNAGAIVTAIEDEEGNIIRQFIVYFLSLIEQKEKVMDTLSDMPEPVKGKALSVYDQLMLEGREKGIEENRRENTVSLYRNGVSVEVIATSFGLKKPEVVSILKEAGLNP